MADDTTLNVGAGGDVIATDDIGGVKHQRVKVTVGADGVNDGDVSTANPMPTDAREVAGNATAVGSGAASTGTQRVILANDQDAIPISSVVPGTAATNLGKAEDVAHASGDTGVAALAVRRDLAAVGSDADADYSTLNVDQHGMLRSVPGGVESVGNTSTTPLGGSATFTGTGEQNDLPDVLVSLFTDQTGTLFFDFSVNGTDFRTFPTAGFAISANTHAFHTAVKGPRFFRARLVNDGTPQTVLQLFTYFGTYAGKPNAPIGQSVNNASDATTVKAVIVGDSGGGSFVNVGVTAGGNFKIDLEDIAGTAVSVNTGVRDIGTQRVTIATDDLVPISVASLPLPTGAATSALQLPDGHNVTVDNAGGASAVNVQDGGNSLTIDAVSLPLPTGAATAAGQLADGHNVTVDNAAGASAVNVQDGGNSLTIDAVSLPLPTGAATSAAQLADGHNVTVDNTIAAPANVQISDGTDTALVSGAGALVVDGSAVTQPISAASLPLPTGAATSAGQLANGHDVTIDNAGAGAAVNIQDGGNTITVDGTVTADAGTGPFAVGGPVASDAPLTGNPLHTGARASTAAPTPVSLDGDAVGVWADRRGALKNVVVDDAGVSCMDGANNALQVNIVAGSGSGTEFNEDDPASGGEAGPAILGVRQDADTSPVTLDGDFHQLIFDAAGNLKVNVKLGGGTGGTSSAFAAAFPGTGTAAGWSDGTNMEGPRVFDADTGGATEFVAGTTLRVPASGGSIAASFATGVRDAGTQRVTIATDDLVPISAASLPLPAGAATSAGQLSDGHNVTIDNAGAGAAVNIQDGGNTITVDGTVTADAGTGPFAVGGPVASDIPITGNPLHSGGRASTAAPTPVSADGDAVARWVDRRGAQKNVVVDDAGVSCMDGGNNALQVNVVATVGGGGGTSSTFGAAFPATGTAAGWTDGTNMEGPRVFDVDSGGGTEFVPGANIRVSASGGSLEAAAGTGVRSAATLRVTIATDDLVPISAASLPLPAGAATSALQLADGHNVTVDNGAAGAAVNIQDGGNIITVDGTVVANAGTGDFLSIAAHTINEAFKEANAVGGQFDDTTTTVATEDNIAPVRITAQRAFHANLRNVAGTEIGTAAAPVRTDTTGTTTQPISAASLPLPAGAATSALQLANGHDVTIDNGAAGAAVNIQDGGNTISIDAASLPLPTGAATSALQLAAGHTVTSLGTAAADAPISGNPVPVALRANLNEPTAVADADATYAWADLQGRQVVVLDHPAAVASTTHGPDTTNVTASGDTALVAAPGASLSIYVTNFWVSNNAATKIKAALRDGTTSRWLGTLAADGGGVTGKFDPPWKLTANTALNGNLAATGDVDFNVQFYVSA